MGMTLARDRLFIVIVIIVAAGRDLFAKGYGTKTSRGISALAQTPLMQHQRFGQSLEQ